MEEMNDSFTGRMSLTFVPTVDDTGGYLVSNETLDDYLLGDAYRSINVCFNTYFKSLPPIGFTVRNPSSMPPELPTNPDDLDPDGYLMYMYNDPTAPTWIRGSADDGDRLRLRYYGPINQQTTQFRLNLLTPTAIYPVPSAAPARLIIRVSTPDDVAVLTEDEVVECRATRALPQNRVSRHRFDEQGDEGDYEQPGPSTSARIVPPLSPPSNRVDYRSPSGRDRLPVAPIDGGRSVPRAAAMAASSISSVSVEEEEECGDDSDDGSELPLCTVCQEEPVDRINVPCYHATTCSRPQCRETRPDGDSKHGLCYICRKKVTEVKKIRTRTAFCVFDACKQLNAMALPCGCIVGCYKEARKVNGFRQRGEPQPYCFAPNCAKKVNSYVQIYFP